MSRDEKANYYDAGGIETFDCRRISRGEIMSHRVRAMMIWRDFVVFLGVLFFAWVAFEIAFKIWL